jgi:small subunit ribosomal protein S2
MPKVSVQQLLKAGVHFGHMTRRWNPKMRPFIFTEKNGVHIIDLKKTETMLEDAVNRIGKIVADGGDLLFVGTKDQAKDLIKEEAQRCNMHFVAERWLGGMLTNFRTIRNSIRTLEQHEAKATDGTYEKISKKEILEVERSRDKLEKVLGGIRNMKRLPGALFIVDTNREAIAIAEARKLNIPVFAICDTNSDPDRVDYVIPANDDAYKSIAVITKSLTDAANDAVILRKEKGFGAEGEQAAPKKDKAAPARRRKRDVPTKADDAAPVKAAPKKDEAEKAAPKKAAPKKDEAEKAAPKKAAPKKDEAEKAAPKKAAPKKAAAKTDDAEKAAPKKAAPKKAAPKKAAAKTDDTEKAAPKKAAPKKAAAKTDDAEKAAPKKAAPKKAAAKSDDAADTTEA